MGPGNLGAVVAAEGIAPASGARPVRAQTQAQRVLQQLERGREGMQGPFQPNWESLGAHRVPE